MRKSIPLLLVAALVLTSCGAVRESRFNPFNWFGRGESRQVADGQTNPLIPRRSSFARPDPVDMRTPVQQITSLVIERTPTGGILRAEGLTARQGAYDLGLKQVEDPEVPADTLRYVFVANQPLRAQGPEATRRVVVAEDLSVQDLDAIRRIEVVGAANVMTARR